MIDSRAKYVLPIMRITRGPLGRLLMVVSAVSAVLCLNLFQSPTRARTPMDERHRDARLRH